jgi:AmmeMemoRadiSam system protein A
MTINNKYFLPLADDEKTQLLTLARSSIVCHLISGKELIVNTDDFPPSFQQDAACCVTLTLKNKLRGSIGTSYAQRPLVLDIIHNAYSAAFDDPRYNPVKKEDIHDIKIDISVLTTPTPISFLNEEDLLDKLQGTTDGIILQEGVHKATFLPSAWKAFSNPSEFIAALKVQAGLNAGYWSDNIVISRYQTINLSE